MTDAQRYDKERKEVQYTMRILQQSLDSLDEEVGERMNHDEAARELKKTKKAIAILVTKLDHIL